MPATSIDSQTSILDSVRLLAKSFRVILLAGIIGAVAGLTAFQMVHPRWTAKVAVRLGQVASLDAKGSLAAVQPIENQLTATERYNQPSVHLQVLNALGLPSPDAGNRDASLIFNSLKATAGRSPNVINIEVSAYSRESATAALEKSLEIFSAGHRKLFDNTVRNMQSNLAGTQSKLAAAQQDYARVNETLKSATSSRSAPNVSTREVLASSTATLIRAQILGLQQQVVAYQDALNPLRSYPTEAMAPVYVPTHSSTPGIAIFIIAGAALGLMVGATLALFKNSVRST
ncbi:hypothetical protein ACU8YE_00575 [Ralstonia sp. VS2407]